MAAAKDAQIGRASRAAGARREAGLPTDERQADAAAHSMSSARSDKGAPFANRRPKDASTLIVLRRKADTFRILMGRRSEHHAFMPGAVVFPGGRVDRGDWSAPSVDELHPNVAAKLTLSIRSADPRRSRAIALAGIRETFEETGIAIGRKGGVAGRRRGLGWHAFLATGVVPTLSPLRLIARAITPPRRSRRFDARFFAVFDEAIAAEVDVPDDELLDPCWLTFEEARDNRLPLITRTVLDLLEARLARDPNLNADDPVPFYVTRHGRHLVEHL